MHVFFDRAVFFLEVESWRRREDEVEKVGIFLIGGNIFSIKGAFQNLLLSLKDEWGCALDTSTDVTKADVTNEALELFYFWLEFLSFPDAEVSNFFDDGWVSGEDSECDLVFSSLVLFFEDLVSWSFLKE